MHNRDTVSKIIVNLTVTVTSPIEIPGIRIINIRKAMVVEITAIISGTTPVLKMIMAITGTGITGMEEAQGEINMITRVTIKEDGKVIPINSGTETQGTIEGTVMTTEINNFNVQNPATAGFFYLTA